jgi:toxin-antitoxin system PIN domain toxin
MMILLDVNLLFILHQPLHSDFLGVKTWFQDRISENFATCPITQSGMIRLLVQGVPGFTLFTMEEAREALDRFTHRPNHIYWPDDPSYLTATQAIFARMQGHRQITGAYLLGLAIHNKGKLATLDRGIRHLAGKEFAVNVELIEPDTSILSEPSA